MDKKERLNSVLAGRMPDRPPVSFWHHFGPDEAFGARASDAHARHVERYDLDFVKIMNDNPYPRGGLAVIESREDLRRLTLLDGREEPFPRQLELISDLRRRLGAGMLMTTTGFSPWTVLRKLAAPEVQTHRPPELSVGGDPRDRVLRKLAAEDRAAVKAALQTIAASLANFAAACVAAGADGIFLSVRDDWVDEVCGAGTYDELVVQADLAVCEAVKGAPFNMLHVCGRALDFGRFAAYPLQVLNWADRYAGPAIRDVRAWLKPAICGGVDNLNTLVRGSEDDCRAEVRDALEQAGGRPVIISAGCTYDPAAVPESNLEAVCRAARGE